MSNILIKPSKQIKYLRADVLRSNVPRLVNDAHYSYVSTKKFDNPTIIHLNDRLAKEIGFTSKEIASIEFKKLLVGKSESGIESFAMNYGGHQFGHWAGQLGDGRAINIGERSSANHTWQLQLKGAGPTPYSRKGDGYAVLRSSIREHLCSEAMYYLGIPTTRSLSLALTGESVYRDMFYNGNAAYEKGAVVCRVAQSFIRFGNFQIHAANGEIDLLKELTDYTITNHFKGIDKNSTDKYLSFFKAVATRTLEMIMNWQRVGFVHGVMNTDNLSIIGDTIDYGPYGWLDNYDTGWTPNTTDNQHKRYRYGAQPEIGLWNLWQLANALFELVDDSKALEGVLDQYKEDYGTSHIKMMSNKLGLIQKHERDESIINQILTLLEAHETDMTIFYRELINVNHSTPVDQGYTTISKAFYDHDAMSKTVKTQWIDWLSTYINRLKNQKDVAVERIEIMSKNNPKYVLRNYMAQMVIEKAELGDYSLLQEIFDMIQDPYTDRKVMDHWYAKRPDWARDKPGVSQLSCSS